MSLIIIIYIKVEGQKFLSKGSESENSNKSDSFRIRQTIRDAYHQVVDGSNQVDPSKTTLPISDSLRIRQTIRDTFNKIVDKNSDETVTKAVSDSHIIRKTVNDIIDKVKPSSDDDSSSFRIRQTIGGVVNRVVDEKSSENSSSFRIRQTISDSIHRVVDKPADSIKCKFILIYFSIDSQI